MEVNHSIEPCRTRLRRRLADAVRVSHRPIGACGLACIMDKPLTLRAFCWRLGALAKKSVPLPRGYLRGSTRRLRAGGCDGWFASTLADKASHRQSSEDQEPATDADGSNDRPGDTCRRQQDSNEYENDFENALGYLVHRGSLGGAARIPARLVLLYVPHQFANYPLDTNARDAPVELVPKSVWHVRLVHLDRDHLRPRQVHLV